MSVLATQFLRRTAATLLNAPAAPTEVDIFGPESETETPYAENTDHVIRPRQLRQNEAGFVIVDLPAAFVNANIFLRGVEIWSRNSIPFQRGLGTAMFPTGAAVAASPMLKRTVFASTANDTPTTLAATLSILGGTLTGSDATKDTPALKVNADEFVKLRLFNNTGGPLTDTIDSKFDLGRAAVNTSGAH